MKIETFSDIPLLRLFVYGNSGSGKTRLVGSAMECKETSPVLVLNVWGQPTTLRVFEPPPFVITMEGMSDFTDIYRWLAAGQSKKEAPDPCKEYLDKLGADRFRTVALDCMTHIQRIALEEITNSTGALPGSKVPQAQIQHWGELLRMITKLVSGFYELDMHVIITALARRNEVPALNMTLFAPMLWGQASLEAPSYAEITGRLINLDSLPQQRILKLRKEAPPATATLDKAFNVLFIRGGKTTIAKWQGLGDPPEFILGPTISMMINVLTGKSGA